MSRTNDRAAEEHAVAAARRGLARLDRLIAERSYRQAFTTWQMVFDHLLDALFWRERQAAREEKEEER